MTLEKILSEHNLKALHIMGKAYSRKIDDEEFKTQIDELNKDTQAQIKIEVAKSIEESILAGRVI